MNYCSLYRYPAVIARGNRKKHVATAGEIFARRWVGIFLPAIAIDIGICYNVCAMEKRVHFYVSRKNVLTWLMALCLVGSAVARIVIPCVKGTGDSLNVWSQIVLPAAATLLYVFIVLADGQERFYKTAIPVCLMAVFYAIRPHTILGGGFIRFMYYTCLVFYCFLYTAISCGRIRWAWLLVALFGAPLGAMGWFLSKAYGSGSFLPVFLDFLPDILLFLGAFLMVFAIRVHSDGRYHPTWGDRADGRRIRSMNPIDQIVPFLMVHRNESSNLFANTVEVTQIERYIRQKRREGMTNFGINHVLVAAYARAVCKYPAINRFMSGQQIYSRGDDLQYCMTIKQSMSADSPDSVIKIHLKPTDTANDVYTKLSSAVEEVRNAPEESSLDSVVGALNLIPRLFLKFVVWLLKLLDYFGLIPKFLLEVSPFHASVYFTSMGSLGIPPVYHHLYNFGNIPIFVSFGRKRHAVETLEDGTQVSRKYVDMKITVDERIVDGFYYASFLKHFNRVLMHPELLDNPPEEVLQDID